MSNERGADRLGIWSIGARGSIATSLAYGLFGLQRGLLRPTGVRTLEAPFDELSLAPLDSMVLGGTDVTRVPVATSGEGLVRQRILTRELHTALDADVREYDARLRVGPLVESCAGIGEPDPAAVRLGSARPRDQIASIVDELRAFRDEHDLDRVVVVNVASTEAHADDRREWTDLRSLESALDAGRAQPASIVYAYAAFAAGCPYVNFTPSRGSSIPALRELARRRGLPHCGNDGKTGETLVKTALAPMFTARALRVLSWQGYNMLGNRDGEVLADPAHREAKLKNKDLALRSILGDDAVHSHVGIDFVPSLEDWKTAWDFVHFEGFLGARMTLQFTWTGSDSALAAPLVLDLARLGDFAARRGEAGEMTHTACFFKAPLHGGTHDFHAQFASLLEYVHGHASRVRRVPPASRQAAP